MTGSAALLLFDARTVHEALPPASLEQLSASEAARYRHFLRPARQRQFLLGRALARQALARLCGVAPHQVVLEEVPGQAPRVVAPYPVPGLSISHSGAWIACAVSADAALGLDIEMIDPGRDIDALALHAFDAALNRRLAAQPRPARVHDFYQLWSRQEALVKLGRAGGHWQSLEHPELAVVLCSAEPVRLAGDTYQLVHQLGGS